MDASTEISLKLSFNFFARFEYMKPALFGLSSRTKVCGLQKVRLANPAPCKPIISEALLNKLTGLQKEDHLK